MVDGGLPRPETSLRRAAEATCLSPLHKTVIEDGGVQPVEGLPNRYGPVICRVHRASLLVNWGHKPRADARWDAAMKEEGIQQI